MTNVVFQIPANAVIVGLCAGRHDMPVGEFIFPTEVDPTDFEGMQHTVDAFLDNRVGTHLSNYSIQRQRVRGHRGDNGQSPAGRLRHGTDRLRGGGYPWLRVSRH